MPRPGLGLRGKRCVGESQWQLSPGREGRQGGESSRGKGYLFSSMVAVHRQQWCCQHLSWAHSGLLMPLCPVLMAWNVCSPILPVSLQCRSGDVTNCRPPAQAPSCHCSTTLPPSCAFPSSSKWPPGPALIRHLAPLGYPTPLARAPGRSCVRQSRPFAATCANVLPGGLASLAKVSLLWSEGVSW